MVARPPNAAEAPARPRRLGAGERPEADAPAGRDAPQRRDARQPADPPRQSRPEGRRPSADREDARQPVRTRRTALPNDDYEGFDEPDEGFDDRPAGPPPRTSSRRPPEPTARDRPPVGEDRQLTTGRDREAPAPPQTRHAEPASRAPSRVPDARSRPRDADTDRRSRASEPEPEAPSPSRREEPARQSRMRDAEPDRRGLRRGDDTDRRAARDADDDDRRLPPAEAGPPVRSRREPDDDAPDAAEDSPAYVPSDRGSGRKNRREAPTPKPIDVMDDEEDRPTEEGPIVSPRSIAGRGLTVVIAIMTFLCALLVGGAVLIDRAAGAWSANVLDEITVTVLPLDDNPLDARLDQVASILAGARGLSDVVVVPLSDSEALLEPWLGDDIDLSPLPIPRLVTARRTGEIDAALSQSISQIPGASLDDHTEWSERLSRMASAAAGGAIGALALMLIATCISIVFATRSAIATNAATVEVLNALGAEDRFIVRAFRRRFVGIGVRGAGLGIAVALVLFGLLDLWSLISSGARSAQSRALLGDPSIGLFGYAALAVVAAGVVILVAVTSAASVRRHLESMYH
ncbi:hypothetical protein [Acuticoccus sediminis]|uniref:hypothetical protein n=1 Tax=Acuticoccus sediminis TaxID=2184697 RepID=UPI001CFECFDC|nr:hypothetical protein [Acuticoccus sediminis]